MKSVLIDMDGVLVRGPQLVPGADAFIERLAAQGRKFLVLTNNSERTRRGSWHPSARSSCNPLVRALPS